MTPTFILIKLAQASLLLPISAGFVYYKKLNQPFRIFFYFVIVAFLFEIQASIAKVIFHNNMPGQHVYTLVEFLAFSTVYLLHFRKNRIVRLLIGINIPVGIIMAFADAYLHGLKVPNVLSITYSFISIVVYALLYFYTLFNKDTTQYSWEHPMFWVSTSALIYFGGNVLYFMLKPYLLQNASSVENTGNLIHLTSNIIAHCILAQSFRCFKKWKEES